MKPTIFILCSIFLSCTFACEEEEPSTIEEDQARLDAMFERIQTLASSDDCVDPSIWRFTAYGDKPCGGPWGYIAYPTTIDVDEFLDLVEEHRQHNQAFNEKWGPISDCKFEGPPTRIACDNNEPVFVFE